MYCFRLELLHFLVTGLAAACMKRQSGGNTEIVSASGRLIAGA